MKPLLFLLACLTAAVQTLAEAPGKVRFRLVEGWQL